MSGSSGRLIVENTEPNKKDWPGKVFEDPDLSYEEAMLEFVSASEAGGRRLGSEDQSEEETAREIRRKLKLEDSQLRKERREVREKRRLEDMAWKRMRADRKEQMRQGLIEPKAELFEAFLAQRRVILERRKDEDELWHDKRLSLRERLSGLPIVTAWIAILVIVDNCTRQCLGLPLFVVGAKVTSEMVAQALRVLLPPELQFLISDRGLHFNSRAFKRLALNQEFIHVLTARHRPQSNGIAERFVRTLKEWLMEKSWEDDKELAELLERFVDEYNDRPHQGLKISGLSPNEFAKRIRNG